MVYCSFGRADGGIHLRGGLSTLFLLGPQVEAHLLARLDLNSPAFSAPKYWRHGMVILGVLCRRTRLRASNQ